jgi:phage baseplate assembly protein gpV
MALPTDFVDGDVLSAADVNGITTAVNAKPDDLADLGDVDLAGLADGDFLKYDNASGNWLVAQERSPIGLILALGG